MMSLKKCLWQVQDSVIMYLKRNFWAPPHQKTLLPLCSKYSVNENQTSLSKLYFINLNTECYLLLSILCLQHLRDTCSAHPNIEVNLPFKCSHCQERLRTQRALDIHVGRWHAGLLNTFDLNWICRIHLPASSILTSQAGNNCSI